MDAKEKVLRAIEEALDEYARWARRAGGSRSDAVEEFYRELLNRAFGYELKNMNRVKGNYPGIDLADEDAGVAVQVTTTETAEKVKKTLKQFLDDEKGLYRQYPRLIVAVAGDSKGKSGRYDTRGFDFQPGRDIWDIARLVRELYSLPQEKLEEIEAFLRKRTSRLPKENPVLQLPTPEWRSSVEFLGREAELAWIEEELRSGTKPVVIAGLGGIGKTALAVKFRRRWEGQVYFARFDTSFTRTLADSVGMAIEPQERRGLNEEQTAELALSYLRRCEPGDLLIVDNAEVAGKSWAELTRDPFYEKIRRLPMAVLMTTRHRDTGGRWLGRLAQEELREIFRRHEVTISEGEMDALIEAVDGHTMTVDMIARTIRESWGDVTAEIILTAMETSTLHAGDFDDIENDHDPEQGKIYAHLRALFDLSGISEDGKHALRCATLLPQNGMDAKLFRTALPEGAAKEIKILEKKGWVDLKEGLVTIHPVVRLVCRTELKPTEENCEAFLRNVEKQYNQKAYDHRKYAQMAELFTLASTFLEDITGFWANQAGYLWNELAETQKAQVCNLHAVARCEKYQPNSNGLASSYLNLAKTYEALGDNELALEYQLKALEIFERTLPSNHPYIAASYNNAGVNFGALGDHEKEQEYLLKALAIWEQVLPSNHPHLAASYNNIGCYYDDWGDHEKALEYKRKALTIKRQELPANHPQLAIAYISMGYTCGEMGNHREALDYDIKGLAILEQVLPENHPDLASGYNNVGCIYDNLGDHQKALEYKLKALAIRERVLTEDHPDLARSCNNVGTTYGALGEHQKALEYSLKALEIRERVLPGDHPDLAASYNNVGGTYGDLGEQQKALEYSLKALAIWKRVLPEDHPDLATSYNNVGSTYGALGDHRKELAYMLKALEIRERALPGNHPNLAQSCNNIAWTYHRLGQINQAAAYMRRAADIINCSTLPEHHPHRVKINQWADRLEREARQARGGDDPTPVSS